MKFHTATMLLCLLALFFKTDRPAFTKHIQFNHLYIVIDDSTYAHLFDSLKFTEGFAKTSEEKVSAGNTCWTGKYVYGLGNYLEFFRPGGMRGAKFGDFGMGFISDSLGTIDAVQQFWSSRFDSVHVENKVITDNGISSPWFKSVSIPNTDSSKVTAGAFENAREEMQFAGFGEKELSGVISYAKLLPLLSGELSFPI